MATHAYERFSIVKRYLYKAILKMCGTGRFHTYLVLFAFYIFRDRDGENTPHTVIQGVINSFGKLSEELC